MKIQSVDMAEENFSNTLVFLTKKFKEYKDREAKAKTEMEEARALKEQWEEALLSKMLEDDVQNIKTSDGLFYSREDVYAGYDKDREAEMFKYLQEGGHAELIRPTINARTLTAWVKEQMEQGEVMPDFVNVTRKKRVGLRK